MDKNQCCKYLRIAFLIVFSFLIYISDLTECLSINAKLFDGDTYFCVIHCTQASANDLKWDKTQKTINKWTF